MSGVPNVGHEDHDLVDVVLCDRSKQLFANTSKPPQTEDRSRIASKGVYRNESCAGPVYFAE